MILDTMFSFMCECGKMFCHERILMTDQSLTDFQAYNDQRDEYCLISKSCKSVSEISPSKIVIEGDDYLIVEEG